MAESLPLGIGSPQDLSLLGETKALAMGNNPFTPSFWGNPGVPISRGRTTSDALAKFVLPESNCHVLTISGVRGSGKTAFLYHISKTLSADSGWAVVDINPHSDMVKSFCSLLRDECLLGHLFGGNASSLSFDGDVMVKNGKPIRGVEPVLVAMLVELRKQKKKVLVTVDNVVNGPSLRAFVDVFQRLLLKRLPVYLLANGTYANIKVLEHWKIIPFLVGALRVDLEPLFLPSIMWSYQSVLGLEIAAAAEATKLTKGYAFAYQALGSILFDNGGRLDKPSVREFDEMMARAAYPFVWGELGGSEKRFVLAMDGGANNTGILCAKLGMSQSNFSSIRARLIKRGVLLSPGYGLIEFALPRFYKYVQAAAQ